MQHIRPNFRAASAVLVFALTYCGFAKAEAPIEKRPVLLDCAIGTDIDDAFALALATADPTIELSGVTTVSGKAEDRAWMVCRFLSAIGQEKIPVAYGRGNQPPADIKGQFQYRYHPAVLYGRTAKPVKQAAVELLHARLADGEAKKTIVCTGPLTNVAQLLADHPDSKERIERIIVSVDRRNLADDVAAARAVLASGVRIELLPWEWGTSVRLEKVIQRLFARHTLLTLQLQTLYELDRGNSFYSDAVAAAMASADADLADAFVLAPVKATISDMGKLTTVDGESPVRIVKSLKPEPLLDWMQKKLTQGEPALPRELGNRTKPIDRGAMPNRVHVFEDYTTTIERRWWLAGIPAGGGCRGMLTMDFDDLQGDTKTMYRAVVFNPVPGPPMGKQPRLSFRCWLKGTDQLRVQIYSLSNGYHRYLSLADLPQEKWLDLAVDMTAARRPDGSGGPLSEGERIDDIQFYVDPRADLYVDDIVLYDAGADDAPRDFPKRIFFTGWFDTGKQGQEWPGSFEIPAEGGYFWKAARSLPPKGKERPSILVGLRGSRPLTGQIQLDFRYRIDRAAPIEIVLRDSDSLREVRTRLAEPTAGSWQQALVTLGLGVSPGKSIATPQELAHADELVFVLAGDGPLWVDDILLYEPAAGSR
jgi:inosine-uridine nucleoside N-ribohydrolase